MRAVTLLVALLVLAAASPGAQQPTRVDRARLMADLRALADPALEGRRSGSAGGRRARALIVGWLQDAGVHPFEGRMERPFSFSRSAHDVATSGNESDARPLQPEPTIEAANIAGLIPGRDPDRRVIVLSAHYDHLGVRDGVVYPGADDNASGVAAVVAIARVLAAAPLRHPLVLVAFDAEEMGLRGARQFVADENLAPTRVAIDVNLDMVSRNDRREIVAAGTKPHPWLRAVLDDVQRRTRVKIRFGHDDARARSGEDDWTQQSDQGAFAQAGIPFLYFGVEDHADYHRPTDTADRIDAGFYGDVVDLVLDTLVTLDARLD